MKNKKISFPAYYLDGTPSCDYDWEMTGQEEMNDLVKKCKSKNKAKPNPCVLTIRDKLNNIKDIITLCEEALENSQLLDIKSIVTNVLYFCVQENISAIEKELAEL